MRLGKSSCPLTWHVPPRADRGGSRRHGLRDLAELWSPSKSCALIGIEGLSEEIALSHDDNHETGAQDVTQAPQRRRHLKDSISGLSAVYDGSLCICLPKPRTPSSLIRTAGAGNPPPGTIEVCWPGATRNRASGSLTYELSVRNKQTTQALADDEQHRYRYAEDHRADRGFSGRFPGFVTPRTLYSVWIFHHGS